jgi:hypothetical protein
MYLSSLNSYHRGLPSKHQVHDARVFTAPPLSIDNELEGSPMILHHGSSMTIHSGASLHQGTTGDGKSIKTIHGLAVSFRPTPPLEVHGPMKADGILNLLSVHCAKESGRNILLAKLLGSSLDPNGTLGADLPTSILQADKQGIILGQMRTFLNKGKEANTVGADNKPASMIKPLVLSFDQDPLDAVTDAELLASAAEASNQGLDSILDHLIETTQASHYLIVWC